MSDESAELTGYPGVRVLYSDYVRLQHREPEMDDDPLFPFRLEWIGSPPEYMRIRTVGLCGPTPKVILGATSAGALEAYIEKERLERDPHTVSLVLTSPDGEVLRRFSGISTG